MVNNNMTGYTYLYALLPGHNCSYNYIVSVSKFLGLKVPVARAKVLASPGACGYAPIYHCVHVLTYAGNDKLANNSLNMTLCKHMYMH